MEIPKVRGMYESNVFDNYWVVEVRGIAKYERHGCIKLTTWVMKLYPNSL